MTLLQKNEIVQDEITVVHRRQGAFGADAATGSAKENPLENAAIP
jgi:hypothetical protein